MIELFRRSLADADGLIAIYEHCVNELKLPGDYSDLLRMSVVYCLSALDKLAHDLVVHESIEVFAGRRLQSPKFKAESISIESLFYLMNGSGAPIELEFGNLMRQKISYLSFMDPAKLVEALSLVWLESHKWQVIADALGRNKEEVVTELRNSCRRRNSIVHEADIDLSTGEKLPIDVTDARRVRAFIGSLGECVHHLVSASDSVS